MQILLYNYLQPEEGGGGVGVYLRNLAAALAAQGHRVILLSAGWRYTPRPGPPFLDFATDRYERAVVVNSPVPAPSPESFDRPTLALDQPGLDPLPAALIRRYGEIDVWHFHNLEGLTHGFLRAVRAAQPRARLLLSVHNYQVVCAQVNLWQRDREVCEDYADGRACTTCLDWRPRTADEMLVRRLRGFGGATPSRALSLAARALRAALQRSRRLRPIPDAARQAADYARLRRENIALCADVFDRVLAVSRRTRAVILARGMPADLVSVCYIGTPHKAVFERSPRRTALGEGLHVAYLGYMRRDKGFHFLLECLERMPAEQARTLRVTVAARRADGAALRRLLALRGRLAGLVWHDGFTHATLDRVLASVNLGLVPVLWEDNLPQVAIELVSRGIAILTSDRGGASEIAGNPAFTFAAGDHAALIARLAALQSGALALAAFWTRAPLLRGMEEHAAELLAFYDQKHAAVA
jgi:glycosyltransferase involved in cell wall biosynthesis